MLKQLLQTINKLFEKSFLNFYQRIQLFQKQLEEIFLKFLKPENT